MFTGCPPVPVDTTYLTPRCRSGYEDRWGGHELVKIVVHEERCHGCGNCVIACPVNACNSPNAWGGKGPEDGEDVVIKVVNGTVSVINEDLCKACMTCELACPVDAIEIET